MRREMTTLAFAAALAVTASEARAGTDWTTFAYDLQRTGYNPHETAIGAGNAGSLSLKWSFKLGPQTTTQPLVATGVTTKSGQRDLVYAAVRFGYGRVSAVDRTTGALVWHKSLRPTASGIPSGVVGTPTLDRAHHALYAATRGGDVFALDEASGAELAGWPIHVTPSALTNDRVIAGLTLVGSSLYLEVASADDEPPYRGEVIKVDVPSRKVVATWYPEGASGPYGGGLWGMGGVSVEPDGSALYAAVGNGLGNQEHFGYAENVVRLSPTLALQAANYPGLTGHDVDFGATPLLYQAAGCPAQLAVMNKTGALFVYDRGAIGTGYRQRIQMANRGFAAAGDFIGIPAYAPGLGLIYVNNPSDARDGSYKHGLVALRTGADCSLSPAWQRVIGNGHTGKGEYPSIPPTVANGVVYAVRSIDSTVYALNAATGAQLWSSGTQIPGGIFAAVTVANGQVLVASGRGTLYAFAP